MSLSESSDVYLLVLLRSSLVHLNCGRLFFKVLQTFPTNVLKRNISTAVQSPK